MSWPPPTPQRQPASPPTLPPSTPTSPLAHVEPPSLSPMAIETIETIETAGDGPKRPVRWVFIGTFALVAALVCALVVVMAQPSSDSDTAADEAGGFSLAAAATRSVEARTMEFRGSVALGGEVFTTIGARLDGRARLADMTVDLDPSTFDRLGLPASAPTSMRMIFDATNDVAYISAEAFGPAVPGDPDWLSYSEAELGQDLDAMFLGSSASPQAVLGMFVDDHSVEFVGDETITSLDGGEIVTRHLVVTLDLREVVLAQRDLLLDSGATGADIDAMMAELGNEAIDYHLWIDEHEEIRRMSVDLEVDGLAVATTFDLATSDEPLALQLPPAGVVVPASDLLLD